MTVHKAVAARKGQKLGSKAIGDRKRVEKAKEIWDELIYSAKNHAEPGLMYWDNVLDYDPAAVYDQFKPTCSNPCGEQFLNPNDSCRLMVLNLFSFVKNPFTEEADLFVIKPIIRILEK